MFVNTWKKEIFTLPNLLSLLRLLLIPVYVTLYQRAKEPGDFFIAAGVLGLSCLTDWVDGKIARHFGMISVVGKVLDPVADKATQFALILCLGIRFPVLSWLVIPFVIKECFQLIAGTLALKKGRMLDGALFAGKICTVVLFVSFLFLAMFPALPKEAVVAITCLDGFFLLFSFLTYFFAYFGKQKKLRNI
jgi:cardiolipin synthase